ncbi:MAG: TolC family protein [Paludibacteraceae bacterium]|nr:TolC family protein [Paludibacteraceae bacterium]
MKRGVLIVCSLMASFMYATAADTLSLSFDSCRQIALKCSNKIRKADNNVSSADWQRSEVMSKFFPSAKAVGSVVWTPQIDMMEMEVMQIPIALSMQMKGMYIAGLMVSQPLFAGGQIANGYRLSKVGLEAAKEQAAMERANIVAEVAQAYYAYVAVRSKQTMLNDYAIQLDTLMSQVGSSVEVGMSTDAERLRVETAQRQLAYQQKRVKTGVELCRMALTNILNMNYDSVFIVPENVHFEILQSPPSRLEQRPENRLLALQVKAAKIQKQLTIGKYLPTIGLSAAYTWFGNMNINGTMTTQMGAMPIEQTMKMKIPAVMLSVSVPLTDWAGGAYAIKRAKADVSNAELDRDYNQRMLQLEMRRAILNLTDGEDLVKASALALESATEALRVVRDRYEVGLSPLSDLLAAQTDWQKAESDYIEAQTQYRINEIEYLRTSGNL